MMKVYSMNAKREALMVELVVRDYQLGMEEVESVEVLFSFEQVKGYAKACGLVELDAGQRVLVVYKLAGEEWQEVLEYTENDLEY